MLWRYPSRALWGWARCQRARLAKARHPELGEIGEFCFYATRLRFGDLAFDVGAWRGDHTRQMVERGANVVAVEPQADFAANLARLFPTATVLPVAVGDRPGQASLNLATEHTSIASLDRRWEPEGRPLSWYDAQPVDVVTVGDLISRYGVPRLLKIDTEGLDHQVLRTLDRPVEHILFEVQGARVPEAEQALQHLDGLGSYEYRLSERHTWVFSPPGGSAQILDLLAAWDNSTWGNVYARLRRP